MNKPELILIGGGGHCKSCIDVIETENKFSIAGIVDLPEKIGEKMCGYPIIGSDLDLEKLRKNFTSFFITLGQIHSPHKRIELFNRLVNLNCTIPVIISPLAHVSRFARVDAGTIIMHQAIVNTDACIGKNCIINTKALIEHDVCIDDHCHISTGAIVNGGVTIKQGTFFGSGAVSKEYTEIPEFSFIKANSIVK
jgi:sugar O-acyltransferase (sialic acid O-acetyltransferase NeuD family)